VILLDAGPLVALVNRSDAWHEQCLTVSRTIREPLLTVWPAVTEAVFLVRRSIVAQTEILRIIEGGEVRFAELDRSDLPRMRELITKYRDLPMDLADAALVRVAERERIRAIFTLDRHDFEIYRPARIGRFRIMP
jgi:predicted nucleic acid-binding protein